MGSREKPGMRSVLTKGRELKKSILTEVRYGWRWEDGGTTCCFFPLFLLLSPGWPVRRESTLRSRNARFISKSVMSSIDNARLAH